MKPVVQRERTGCGIASVATLAGISYAQAKRAANRLGIFAEDPRLWPETQPVRDLLAHFHIRAAGKETPFVSWGLLPDVALLAIKWHREQERAYWHWVVFWGWYSGGALAARWSLIPNRRYAVISARTLVG